MDSFDWQNVPIIDVEALRKSFHSEEGKKQGRKFAQAAAQVGFVCITNHGVNRDLIDRAEKVAKEFFNKPTNFKTAFNNENQKLLDTGYFPAKLDGKEGFDILHHGFKWENKDDITETKLPSDNEVTDFSSTINKYADEMCELAKVLLHAISRAYRYAPAEISAFDKIMDQHKSTIRLNYYPKMSETKKTSPIDGSFLACPEHYDSGLLTILSQDMVGGLQVQRPRDKVWVDVVPRRDVLVINTGRAMEIISNGRSLATYHRVKFTPNTERISIPFFLAPNKDAQIFPFGVPEKERKYESIEYLVWWNEKMRPTFPEYAQRK